MSDNKKQFWDAFAQKSFDAAATALAALSDSDQAKVLETLFQKAGNQNEPYLLSCLKGTLAEGHAFKDYYDAWFPPKDACDPMDYCGEHYQQYFKGPVRVMNAINVNDPKEVLTVALIWANTSEEKAAVSAYLQSALSGGAASEEERHESIKKAVDERELLGIYQVASDDNLGTPF